MTLRAELNEFIEELVDNQYVNKKEGLENRIDIDYVLDRLLEIKQEKSEKIQRQVLIEATTRTEAFRVAKTETETTTFEDWVLIDNITNHIVAVIGICEDEEKTLIYRIYYTESHEMKNLEKLKQELNK